MEFFLYIIIIDDETSYFISFKLLKLLQKQSGN